MDKDKKIKFKNSEKGVSLIITFFVMIIILSVALSISILLYGELKIIRNVGNSTVGLYAADSGIEKVLYYDRHVVPAGAVRGLCSMFDLTNIIDGIPRYCAISGTNSDSSIYCFVSAKPQEGTKDPTNGCNPAYCDDCTVSFNTTLDNSISSNYINYSTTASVYPSGDHSSDFEIDSKGTFSDSGRQIQTVITTCSGNWDPAYGCTQCLSGWSDVGGNNCGSQIIGVPNQYR